MLSGIYTIASSAKSLDDESGKVYYILAYDGYMLSYIYFFIKHFQEDKKKHIIDSSYLWKLLEKITNTYAYPNI